MLSYLGRAAVRLGLYDEAKKTYAQMTRVPEQASEGYAALLKVEEQHGTNGEVLQTLKRMMTDFPAQSAPKNDWAYLNLLLNTDVNAAWATAKTLYQTDPQILAYRTTLALGYLRKENAAGAENLYEGLPIEWNTAAPSAKLIYAAVLAANGKKDEAAGLVRALDRSKLRPEEWAVIDAYLPGT